MAAGVAGDVVAFAGGKPYLLEPFRDLILRCGEADVGAACALVRRGIGLLGVRRQQEDAREEIGEMRAGATG